MTIFGYRSAHQESLLTACPANAFPGVCPVASAAVVSSVIILMILIRLNKTGKIADICKELEAEVM